MSSLFRLEQQQKTVLKIHFEFAYFSFGIETRNTFVHSRSTLGNHTRFHTEMIKVYTIPFGAAHTYMAYIGEYPPPRAKKLFRQFCPFCPTRNRRSNFPLSDLSLCTIFFLSEKYNFELYTCNAFVYCKSRKDVTLFCNLLCIVLLVTVMPYCDNPDDHAPPTFM